MTGLEHQAKIRETEKTTLPEPEKLMSQRRKVNVL
jgi:hypothetical protein